MDVFKNILIALLLIILSPILIPLGFVTVIGCTIVKGINTALESSPSGYTIGEVKKSETYKNGFNLADYFKFISPILISLIPMILYSPNKVFIEAKIVDNKEYTSFFNVSLHNNTLKNLFVDNTNSIEIAFNAYPDTILISNAKYSLKTINNKNDTLHKIIIQDLTIDKFSRKDLLIGFKNSNIVIEDIKSKNAHLGGNHYFSNYTLSFILFIVILSIIFWYAVHYFVIVYKNIRANRKWVKENEHIIDDNEFKTNLLSKGSNVMLTDHKENLLKLKPPVLLGYSMINIFISFFFVLFFIVSSVLEFFSIFYEFPNKDLNNIFIYGCIISSSLIILVLLIRNIITINSYNSWLFFHAYQFEMYYKDINVDAMIDLKKYIFNSELYEAFLLSPMIFDKVKLKTTPFKLGFHRFVMILMIILLTIKIVSLALII